MKKVAASIQIKPGEVKGLPCVKMLLDDQEYVMLTIKRNNLAVALAKELTQFFKMEVITGMAFVYMTPGSSLLELYPDPSVVGIYVRAADFGAVKPYFDT